MASHYYQPSTYEQYINLLEGARANPIIISSDEESDIEEDTPIVIEISTDESSTDESSTDESESDMSTDGYDDGSPAASNGEGCSHGKHLRHGDMTSESELEGGELDVGITEGETTNMGRGKITVNKKQNWVICGVCKMKFQNTHRLQGHLLDAHGFV